MANLESQLRQWIEPVGYDIGSITHDLSKPVVTVKLPETAYTNATGEVATLQMSRERAEVIVGWLMEDEMDGIANLSLGFSQKEASE